MRKGLVERESWITKGHDETTYVVYANIYYFVYDDGFIGI